MQDIGNQWRKINILNYYEGDLVMKCPYCSHLESKVIDSRATEEGQSIRRRRECLLCNKRFTTYETIEKFPLMVIKMDGRREMFDAQKILNGLLRSCEKRPVSLNQIQTLVEQVERELRNTMEREISSEQIGETVMKYLKDLDEVAYVRFASVYRRFADIENFMAELQKMMKFKQS